MFLRTACKVKPNISAKIKSINTNGGDSARSKVTNTHKSNKFQNTIRNSLEKQQQQQQQHEQQQQSELKQQVEDDNKLNEDESLRIKTVLNIESLSQQQNKIQNKEKIVNKSEDGLIKQTTILTSNPSSNSSSTNTNANTNTNQNLALFLNLLKNQAWTMPPSPTSPVQHQQSQQQQQQQQNLLNLSFLPLVQNNAQFQLATLLQNPLLANILNIRLNAPVSPTLVTPQNSSTSSCNSSNSSLDDTNDSSFCQNQPINLSKMKEDILTNDAPLDLSNRKVEKKISQENVHTVNSLYSTTINRNTSSFSDLNGN